MRGEKDLKTKQKLFFVLNFRTYEQSNNKAK